MSILIEPDYAIKINLEKIEYGPIPTSSSPFGGNSSTTSMWSIIANTKNKKTLGTSTNYFIAYGSNDLETWEQISKIETNNIVEFDYVLCIQNNSSAGGGVYFS